MMGDARRAPELLRITGIWLALLALGTGIRPAAGAQPPLSRADGIRAAVFEQLYRDYYLHDRSAPRLIFLNVGGYGRPSAPSEQLLREMRSRMTGPVEPATRLDAAVSETDPSSEYLRDKRTGARGVEFAVGDIVAGTTHDVEAEACYGRAAEFQLLSRYRLRRARGRWMVVDHVTIDQPDVCYLRGRQGSHAYSVLIAKRPIRLRNHTIRRLRGPDEVGYQVDGAVPNGTDGPVPAAEMHRFEVTVDGKRWPVPRRLWSDCYEAHLEPAKGRPPRQLPLGPKYEPWDDDDDGVQVWLTTGGSRLIIKLSGSDGAGSYVVVWVLHRDRRASREVYGPP